jgi:hypothetical protein
MPTVGADVDGWGTILNTLFQDQDTFFLDPDFLGRVGLKKGSDIASTATVTIPTDGNYFVVTGTNAISGINASSQIGMVVWLKFAAALTLTHSATLNLPGDANITTQAGDMVGLVETAAGTWEVWSFLRNAGVPIAGLGNDPAPVLSESIEAPATYGFRDDNLVDLLVAAAVVASAVNYLEMFNAATGNPPGFSAVGTDANIDLSLVTKGTGRVQENGENLLSVNRSDAMKKGMSAVVYDLGTGTGVETLNEADGPLQKVLNDGAFTLDPPTNSTMINLKVTNGTTPGTITTTNFDKVVGSFNATVSAIFLCDVVVNDGASRLVITEQ